MREIKFRGKRLDNGEWVYGEKITCAVSGKVYIFPEGSEINESEKIREEGCLKIFAFEVNPETVGQYTELQDKNGVEIYEGDTVNCDFENRGVAVIGFSLNNQTTMLYQNTACDLLICDFDYFIASFCKKLGSIHDNPELLEVL